jgi:Mrp family chromosome partitioning ATPase
MRYAVHPLLPLASSDLVPARPAARSVVMVTSPGAEPSRATVAFNLATVCAEVGQEVVVVSTDGLEAHVNGAQPPSPADVAYKRERARRDGGIVTQADVRELLQDTRVSGVSMLGLQHFIDHPTHLVVRMPEVLDVLHQVVDVVVLDVPSFLSVHHGEGLAPLADVVLVVGERRSTTLNDMRKISTVLRRLGAPVAGMALTDAPGLKNGQWDDTSEENAAAAGPVGPLADGTAVVDGKPIGEGAVDGYGPTGFGARREHPADTDVPPHPET